jgi:hypothetical protein
MIGMLDTSLLERIAILWLQRLELTRQLVRVAYNSPVRISAGKRSPSYIPTGEIAGMCGFTPVQCMIP